MKQPIAKAKAQRRLIMARLADAVRRQDWFTVLVEIAIVVLGVVIGFQVTAWGQARADARLGRAYTERLLADLRVERLTRRGDIDYYGEVEASAQRADSLLSARSTELGSLLVNAYRATEFVYSPRKRDTWDEIVASGHIGLLPNELASGVEYLFAQNLSDQVVLALRVSPYRRRVRSVLPHTVQTAIRKRCSDIVGSGGQSRGCRRRAISVSTPRWWRRRSGHFAQTRRSPKICGITSPISRWSSAPLALA